MKQRYLIIADDFTGSNDTGVQLRRNGIPVKVVLHLEDNNEQETSVVIDTESRGLSGEEAFRKVSAMVREIDYSSFDCVIKKVDSTLRGNIAEEIAAVDQFYHSELIVFAPALPDLGRTTSGGIHKLNGVPISSTEIGRDPKKPVKEDRLPVLLSSVFDEKVCHISLEQVRGGFTLGQDRICTFDAETNADMLRIIQAAKSTGKKILWVGTAAIADTIMRSDSETLPAFGICGSVSEVTNRQLHEAEKAGILLVSVSIPDLLNGTAVPRQYEEKCAEALKSGRDTILLSSASFDRSEIEASVEAGRKTGMSLAEIGVYTQNALGEIALNVMDQVPVSGIFLTGGDTAIGLLRRTGAEGSYITEEIAVGIPKMKIAGGQLAGLPAVTKAGAFGKDDAIVYALRKLKEKD